jgi:hypothetical protein
MASMIGHVARFDSIRLVRMVNQIDGQYNRPRRALPSGQVRGA